MKAIDAVKQFIESTGQVDRSELVDLIREHEPDIAQSNLNWTIREALISSGIRRIGKGKYQKTDKTYFCPEFSPLTHEVHELIISRFPGLTSAVWNTRILNHYTEHMLFSSFIIVEVDKYMLEPVFGSLLEKFEDVFIEPNEDILWRYARKPEVIVVKKLISQAPLIKCNGVKTISAEKLIIDLHSKDAVLAAVRGNETLTIVRSIFQKHSIQFDRLMRYAGRRGLKTEVYETLSKMSKDHIYTSK